MHFFLLDNFIKFIINLLIIVNNYQVMELFYNLIIHVQLNLNLIIRRFGLFIIIIICVRLIILPINRILMIRIHDDGVAWKICFSGFLYIILLKLCIYLNIYICLKYVFYLNGNI